MIPGVLAPAITPFDAALRIDVPRYLEHCHRLLENGCSGLAIFGTTSEANSLSVEERERLFAEVLKSGVAPAKLIPGTGCSALPDTIRLTRLATSAGCEGVLVLPPFYYKNVGDEALFRSYAKVIEGVPEARIYLYHIPQVSGVPVSLKLIERLRAEFPRNVVGIKDSSGNWDNTRAMLDAFPGFHVYAGSEKFLLRNLRHGGAGCITATANYNSKAIDELYRNWKTPGADALQEKINAVRDLFEQYPTIPALKAALQCPQVRPPLLPLTEQQTGELREKLSRAA